MTKPVARRRPLRSVGLGVTLTLVLSLGGYAGPPVANAATSPFTDIVGTTFEADIDWLYAEGITVGCTPTLYCPERTVTRGEMASFLVRMFVLTEGGNIDAFSDDDGTTHEVEINRLAYAGVTKGCTTTTFCPTREVRRDELTSFLARAVPLIEGAGRNYFADDDGTTHEANIDRAATAGIASGCAVWRYCPASAVTRGQMAAFLHRVEAPLTSPPYPAPIGPQTLHVGTSGSDAANLCRVEATPCATISRALSLTLDGDDVVIGPGTYPEEGLVPRADVTITGDPAGGTVIDTSQSGLDLRRAFIIQGDRTVNLVQLTLTNSRYVLAWAGGISNHGTLTITDSTLHGNTAFENAAVWSDGALTIVRSTISGNFGGGSGTYGVAIWNRGTLVLRDSTVDHNESGYFGTAILNEGSASIVNSTVGENHSDYGCGGVYNETMGVLDLVNSTVVLNWSDEIPCNLGNAGVMRVKNSIVLGTTGPVTSRLNSIVGVPPGLTLADILDTAGLQDNGGPTQTIALSDSPSNPAIDKGHAATCAAAPVSGLDQRGLPRTPPCDIGAYELQP